MVVFAHHVGRPQKSKVGTLNIMKVQVTTSSRTGGTAQWLIRFGKTIASNHRAALASQVAGVSFSLLCSVVFPRV